MIETEELNGQKLQGTGTAKDVMTCIKAAGKEKDFPLMCQIHAIAFEGAPPKPDVRNAKCAPEIGEAASAMRGATIGATVNACRRAVRISKVI